MSIRVLRYASLVLALGGMAILYMVAVTGKVPAVGIGAITPAMNSAVIRVTGTVAAVPVTNSASGGYVSFQLAGGGGRLTVVAYEPCAGLLLERGLVPRKGDVVEATGTLNIRAPGTRRLILELPSQLRPAGGGQGPAAGDGRPPGNEPRTARPAGSQ